MIVSLYTGTPDDAALELQAPDYQGPFDDLEFPSPESRDDARAELVRAGRCWLDSTTLAVVE